MFSQRWREFIMFHWITLDGLTDEQSKLVFILVKELKEGTRPKDGGLSSDQQEILNRIMKEFSTK